MSYQMRQRRPQEAAEHKIMNSDLGNKRNLRRRRPSLRYNEDDSQSEAMDLSPVRMSFKEEAQTPSDRLDKKALLEFSPLNRPPSMTKNTQQQIAYRGRMMTTTIRQSGTSTLLKRSQGSLDSSGRSSVVSYDSDDSGVSSRSGGDDHILVPDSPEKIVTTTHKKINNTSITIEVRSPDSRGVIELIEAKEGFIGYFKPTDTPPRQTQNAPKRITMMPAKSPAAYGCVNCMSIRPRITRSVSTNISEDSCDSALQSKRYPNHRTSEDEVSESCISELEAKSVGPSGGAKKILTRRRSSASPIRQKKQGEGQQEEAVSRRKIPTKTYGRRAAQAKSPERKTLTSLKRKRSSKSTTRKSQPSKKKSKTTSTVGKSPLRRIQHHNKSPERTPEKGVQLSPKASRHCRTRSHVKSLLKERTTTSPSHQTSPSTHISSDKQTHRQSRKTLSDTSKPTSLSQKLKTVPTASLRSIPVTLGSDSKFSGEPNSIQEQNEDSGLGSDDQTTAAPSACKWRFCKSAVSSADLVDHIERLHVASQRRNSRVYRCNWEGCKVYGQPAKSIVWLEGHVKKHLGPRPYYCIFPQCTARFASQELLQKHVDNHINDTEPQKAVKKVDVQAAKKADKKPCNKRLRGTEKCLPKRADFFTHNIIDAVHWENKMLLEKWPHLLSEQGDALKLQGQIVAASSHEVNGVKQDRVQLHWYPEELFMPDSWHNVTDSEVKTRTKSIKLSTLPRHLLIDLCKH